MNTATKSNTEDAAISFQEDFSGCFQLLLGGLVHARQQGRSLHRFFTPSPFFIPFQVCKDFGLGMLVMNNKTLH